MAASKMRTNIKMYDVRCTSNQSNLKKSNVECMKAFETVAAAATKHQDLLHSFEEQENEVV